MNDGKALIKKLVAYGVDKLHLSYEDCDYAALLLCRYLGVKGCYFTDFKAKSCGYKEVESELRFFLTENGNFSKEEIDEKVSDVFGLITPFPSVINRSFKTLREKMSAKSACDYFSEIQTNNGYVNADYALSYEESEKKSKSPVSLFIPSKTEDRSSGFSPANYRAVSFSFGEEKWSFSYLADSSFYRRGALVRADEGNSFLDTETLDSLLDFCEFLPGSFCEARPVIEDGKAFCKGFITGEGELPLFLAPLRTSASFVGYQDVEAGEIEWLASAVRLSSYNRNALVCAIEGVGEAWRSRQTAEDASTVNSVTLFLRIGGDNRYVAEIVFHQTENVPSVRLEGAVASLFEESISSNRFAGEFLLSSVAEGYIRNAVDALTDKAEIDEASPLYPFVAELLEKNGRFKDERKGDAAVRDYVYSLAEEALKASSCFACDEKGVLSFKGFLSAAGVKS